jgi:hypothetical protein
MALAFTPGRTIAAGFLCALAATVGVWSGPLASTTTALHTSDTPPAHVTLRSSDQSGHSARGGARPSL